MSTLELQRKRLGVCARCRALLQCCILALSVSLFGVGLSLVTRRAHGRGRVLSHQ